MLILRQKLYSTFYEVIQTNSNLSVDLINYQKVQNVDLRENVLENYLKQKFLSTVEPVKTLSRVWQVLNIIYFKFRLIFEYTKVDY